MKRFTNKLLIILFLFIALSCSDDFLKEDLGTGVVMPTYGSIIYISPEWEAADYQFQLPEMGNADFEIETKPSWLQITSKSGKLVNSTATIHCSVKENSEFAEEGIYIENMKVRAGNQSFFVHVGYFTEGNPRVKVEKTLAIDYSSVISYPDYHHPSLKIENPTDGVLLWEVVSLPDWLSIDINKFNIENREIKKRVIGPHSWVDIPFIFELEPDFDFFNFDYEKDLTGSIILKTNDKNSPTLEVKTYVDLGNPEISSLSPGTQIDFGVDDTIVDLYISPEYSSGVLIWYFEGIPDWISVSASKGVIARKQLVELTCNRSKLQPGDNSATFYLKSNAINEPSVEITVIARVP